MLRIGDEAVKKDKTARKIAEMKDYLNDLLQQQMATVP
jgi:hypothetical protein